MEDVSLDLERTNLDISTVTFVAQIPFKSLLTKHFRIIHKTLTPEILIDITNELPDIFRIALSLHQVHR